jgi:hypothetical protein
MCWKETSVLLSPLSRLDTFPNAANFLLKAVVDFWQHFSYVRIEENGYLYNLKWLFSFSFLSLFLWFLGVYCTCNAIYNLSTSTVGCVWGTIYSSAVKDKVRVLLSGHQKNSARSSPLLPTPRTWSETPLLGPEKREQNTENPILGQDLERRMRGLLGRWVGRRVVGDVEQSTFHVPVWDHAVIFRNRQLYYIVNIIVP